MKASVGADANGVSLALTTTDTPHLPPKPPPPPVWVTTATRLRLGQYLNAIAIGINNKPADTDV